MTTNAETNGNVLHISEGILIAIISAYAYLYVFLNEYGFVSFFNLPESYIRVSLEQILFHSILMIIFVFFVLFMLYNSRYFIRVRMKDSRYSDDFLNNSAKIALVPGMLLGLLVVFNIAFEFIEPIIGITLSFVIILIFVTIYFYWQVIVKKNHLKRHSSEKYGNKDNRVEISIFSYKLRLNYIDIFVIFTILIGFLSFSYMNGYGTAKTRESFFVVNTNPEMVILKSYGETHLLAPFDRKTNIIKRKFTTAEIKDELGLFASYEHLGRLKPAEIIVPVEEVEENQDVQEPPE